MALVVITGASRGIGRELARQFAVEGDHTVVCISRSKQKLDQLKAECLQVNPKSKMEIVDFDLTASNYDADLLPFFAARGEEVAILVNNAGLLINKTVFDLDETDFDGMFDVNVKAPFRLIQLLMPYFSENAHIVNISSMGGYQGSAKFAGLSLYSASKGALAILTESLAEELKDYQVKVNCLALGAVQTEMLNEAFPGYQAPVKPEQMATFVHDFCLNGHKMMNGKILPVSLSTP
ncbi:MAG: SDR family oxidoreductase [Bacteroidales bacterium]|nr:SDR family oxidoreductase [Bacteroidales bacterium]